MTNLKNLFGVLWMDGWMVKLHNLEFAVLHDKYNHLLSIILNKNKVKKDRYNSALSCLFTKHNHNVFPTSNLLSSILKIYISCNRQQEMGFLHCQIQTGDIRICCQQIKFEIT